MNEIEQAIALALASEGKDKEANKAYLEFIKANFIIPIEAHSASGDPEVLFMEDNGQIFLPVFTNMDYFSQWVESISDKVQLLKLSGVDLLKGIGENIIVSLNIGTDVYKEFNPAELARMRSMVIKLFGA